MNKKYGYQNIASFFQKKTPEKDKNGFIREKYGFITFAVIISKIPLVDRIYVGIQSSNLATIKLSSDLNVNHLQ